MPVGEEDSPLGGAFSGIFDIPSQSGSGSGFTIDLGDDGTSFLGNVGAGIVTGLGNIPILGQVFEAGLKQIPGIDQQFLDQLEQTARSSPEGSFTAFGAEFIPTMFAGGAVFNVGRALATRGLAKLAPAVLSRLTGEAIGGAGSITKLAGEVSERGVQALAKGEVSFLTRLTGGPMEKQFADFILKAGDMAGNAELAAIPIPAVLRAAEILGSSAAFATVGTVDALLNEKPLVEALSDGALWGVLTFGLEGGFAVIGKGLFRGSRARDPRADAERFLSGEGPTFLRTRLKDTLQHKNELSIKVQALKEEILQTKGQQLLWNTISGDDVLSLQKTVSKAEAQLRALTLRGRVLKTLSPNRKDILSMGLLRTVPLGAGQGVLAKYELTLKKALLQVGETPEQMAKELGVGSQIFMRVAQAAEAEVTFGRNIANELLQNVENLTREGVFGVQATKRFAELSKAAGERNGKFLLETMHNWEKTGSLARAVGAADAKDTPKLREGLLLLSKAVGLRKRQLKKLDLPVFEGKVPKVLRDDLSEPELLKRLEAAFIKRGASPQLARREADKIISPKSLRRKGSMAFGEDGAESAFPGTLKEALEDGAPFIEDPLVAFNSFFASTARKIAFSKRFGSKLEVVDDLRTVARIEKADIGLFNTITDSILGRTYVEQSGKRLAAAVTNLQIASKLPLAVLYNVGQPVNNTMIFGIRNSWKGYMDALKVEFRNGKNVDEVRLAALKGIGLGDSLLRAMRETFLDPNVRTPFGKLADTVMWGTQFVKSERLNRLSAGGSSMLYAMETMGKAAKGILRGRTLETARRTFKTIGLDLDVMTNNYKRNLSRGMAQEEAVTRVFTANKGKLLETAAWNGSLQTQFLPLKSRKPVFWNTSAGRVAFQFKTFALNQTRFLRDSMVNEAIRGNLRPMAYFLSLYPVVGEITADMRSLFTDDPGRGEKTGIDRALWNFAAVGGLGIAGDVVSSALFGRFAGFLFGPTASDVVEFIESTANGNVGQLTKRVAREPSVRLVKTLLGAPLGLGAEAAAQFSGGIKEMMDGLGSSSTFSFGDDNLPTLEELRVRSTR